MSKEYNPHVIIIWTTDTTAYVKEFSYKEDAEAKYNELLELGRKVTLAKVVRSHGEG